MNAWTWRREMIVGEGEDFESISLASSRFRSFFVGASPMNVILTPKSLSLSKYANNNARIFYVCVRFSSRIRRCFEKVIITYISALLRIYES